MSERVRTKSSELKALAAKRRLVLLLMFLNVDLYVYYYALIEVLAGVTSHLGEKEGLGGLDGQSLELQRRPMLRGHRQHL